MAQQVNIPDFEVTAAGIDITSMLKQQLGSTKRARLISLTLTEQRDGDADQLDLVLDDSDGKLAIPAPGAVVTLRLGWLQGSEVTAGLIDKGSFVVDSVEHSGFPDVLTIHARSADVTGEITTRREQSWQDTTLGAVVNDIAARHSLTPRCAASLMSVPATSVHQSRESDMALLRRLGREHDAVATVKRGALILSPKAAGTTASGAAIPAATITRSAGDRHSYSIDKRDQVTGVEAEWHDLGAATKKRVKVGADGRRKRLSRVYASEAAAKAAASAEQSRLTRLPVKFSFTLALGRPDLYPERRVAVSGFKADIDAKRWLISELTHSLGEGGLSTQIQMELV